jgi:hypothetical protein
MGHFTLDNAGNNQTALNEVSSQLIDRGIDFDPINHRIPCFPHIINLCAQRIINMFSGADFSNVADSWVHGTTVIDKGDYIAAVRGDPIKRARSLVKAIRVSPLRRSAFRKTIISGNDLNNFLDDMGRPVQVPVVELLCDAETRWDSTYIMLNRLRVLRPVRLHLSEHFS